MVSRGPLFDHDRHQAEDARRLLQPAMNRRSLLRQSLALGLAGSALAALPTGFGNVARVGAADVACPPAANPVAAGTPVGATGETIRVTVAYLPGPFFAGFKGRPEDG